MEQLSKSLLGSAVVVSAYQLAKQGLTTWEAPSGEKERELYYAAGLQPYSIKIGDKWVSYSKLGPLAYPFAMAAAFANAKRSNPDNTWAKNTGKAMSGMLAFFGDQSYVRSIGDLVEAIQGGVNVGANAFSGQAANFAGQLIPYKSFLTWVGRMTDPTYRKASTFGERMIKDLPIVGSSLEPYKDRRGNDSIRDFPVLNSFSPFKVTQEKSDIDVYNNYKDSSIKRARINDAKKKLERGQEVSSVDGVYLNMDGSTVDVGKVASMPDTTGYDKVKKQEATFKIIDDVLKLPVDQQEEALKTLGITPYQAQYYSIANSSVEAKTAYVMDEMERLMNSQASRDQVITQILKMREDVNGTQIASDNVLKSLYDNQVISKTDYDNLKKVKIQDGKVQLKQTGRAKKLKVQKLKLIKTKVSKPKKVKIRRIKI
jgi:hypothetical protein